MNASPSTAVQDSVVEATGLSPARRVSAIVCALFGLAASFSPLFVSGTAGAASAGASALLLVSAAALSGPQLIGWLLGDGAAPWSTAGRTPARLALANSRGFSRRLSTAIVPLAVALAVGSVQTSTNSTVATAAAQQLTAGLHADLVVAGPTKLSPKQIADVRSATGVQSVATLSSAALQVQTETDGPDRLAWESATARGVSQGRPTAASIDPGVTKGSLTALGRVDTVAISRDAAFTNGQGMGDRVVFRYGDGHQSTAEVVAIYDRGLGFGDYLFDQNTLQAQDPTSVPNTILIAAVPAATASITQQVSAWGLTAMDTNTYVTQALSSDVNVQRLSTTLLLVLLLFIGLAATNSLVMSTAGRRGEFALLQLVGATRRQIVTMAAVESLIIGAAAWAIGTLASLPAVLGVGYGLLGGLTISMDWPTYGWLSAAVLAISVLSVVPTVSRLTRGNSTPGSLAAT